MNFNIDVNTKYKKNILAKNKTGANNRIIN